MLGPQQQPKRQRHFASTNPNSYKHILGTHVENRAIFAEVFAGCARLSRFAQQAGFVALPVDGPRNVHKPECAVLSLDLCESDPQQCLLSIFQDLQPAAIHLALPCGTGTRARERPLPSYLLKQKAPNPRPLRSQEHPLGVPHLSKTELQKVTSANRLALFTVHVLLQAMRTNTVVTIENPSRSWMWNVLEHYVHSLQNPELTNFWDSMVSVQFSNCAHGGERPKNTTLRSTSDIFLPLALPCPGKHAHKPYTLKRDAANWTFATAEESEYPSLLCYRFVTLLRAHLARSAFRFTPVSKTLSGRTQTKKHPTLVPEYHRIAHSRPATGAFRVLPPLRDGGVSGEEVGEVGEAGANPGESEAFGVYHTPEQFILKALQWNILMMPVLRSKT